MKFPHRRDRCGWQIHKTNNDGDNFLNSFPHIKISQMGSEFWIPDIHLAVFNHFIFIIIIDIFDYVIIYLCNYDMIYIFFCLLHSYLFWIDCCYFFSWFYFYSLFARKLDTFYSSFTVYLRGYNMQFLVCQSLMLTGAFILSQYKGSFWEH